MINPSSLCSASANQGIKALAALVVLVQALPLAALVKALAALHAAFWGASSAVGVLD